ncbi:hypothetical protein GOODEAATRI_015858, partial [Goodea atripinnis]
ESRPFTTGETLAASPARSASKTKLHLHNLRMSLAFLIAARVGQTPPPEPRLTPVLLIPPPPLVRPLLRLLAILQAGAQCHVLPSFF